MNNVRAGLPAVFVVVSISQRAPSINFDSAKVECDYAIESCFLNRIFNRKAKTLESPVFICEKKFFNKKSAIDFDSSIALFNRILRFNSSRQHAL
jgi:hypothetical protein